MYHNKDSGFHSQWHSLGSAPKIKICGVRTLADAMVAADAGADFVGMVFVPERRRRLDGNMGRQIVCGVNEQRSEKVAMVGLFADQPIHEVNELVRRCELDLVQLCGQEPLDYCDQVEGPVIKVVHVAESLAPEDAASSLAPRMEELSLKGHMVTLDRKVEGLQGGTGRTFDWKVAQKLSQEGFRFLLAGGLTPANVGSAVQVAEPWGVDVSSGVETGGIKDKEKVLAFVDAVQKVSRQGGGLAQPPIKEKGDI